jgi:hypothetical protein
LWGGYCKSPEKGLFVSEPLRFVAAPDLYPTQAPEMPNDTATAPAPTPLFWKIQTNYGFFTATAREIMRLLNCGSGTAIVPVEFGEL